MQMIIHFVLVHIFVPRKFYCEFATKIKTIKIKLHVTNSSV